MKANPFLIGGAAVGGAALIAMLIKAFTQKRRDPFSRLVSTLPNRTLTAQFNNVAPKQIPSTVRAFLPTAPPKAAQPQASP